MYGTFAAKCSKFAYKNRYTTFKYVTYCYQFVLKLNKSCSFSSDQKVLISVIGKGTVRGAILYAENLVTCKYYFITDCNISANEIPTARTEVPGIVRNW